MNKREPVYVCAKIFVLPSAMETRYEDIAGVSVVELEVLEAFESWK